MALTVTVGLRIPDGVGAASVWAYNEDSELQWIYDTGYDTLGVVLDSSENVYIVGRAADNGSGMKNFWKLNSSGVLQGGRYVRSDAWGRAVALDSLGRIIVGVGAGAARVEIDLASETNITTSGVVAAVAVDLVDDGIYLGSGGIAANIRRYDSSLGFDWNVNPHAAATVSGFTIMSDRRIVACFNYVAGVNVVYNYTHLGVFSWSYNGFTASAKGVAVDSSDNVYVVSNDSSRTFVKLNSSGVEQWYINHGQTLRSVFVGNGDVVYTSGERKGSVCVWKESSQTLIDAIQIPTNRIDSIKGASSASVTPHSIKVDYYYDNWTASIDFFGANWQAQTFIASEDYTLKSLKLGFLRQGSPGNVTISVRAVDGTGAPTGANLTSIMFNGNNITTLSTGQWDEYVPTPVINLTNGVEYAIVMYNPGGDLFNRLLSLIEFPSPGYPDGKRWTSVDSGTNWTVDNNREIHFETIKAITIAPEITDESGSQSLVSGQQLSLFVTVTGEPTPTYQWYFNDVAITGETNATYITYPGISGSGNYKCIVTNVAGSDSTAQILVTVATNPYRINMFNLYLDHDELS